MRSPLDFRKALSWADQMNEVDQKPPDGPKTFRDLKEIADKSETSDFGSDVEGASLKLNPQPPGAGLIKVPTLVEAVPILIRTPASSNDTYQSLAGDIKSLFHPRGDPATDRIWTFTRVRYGSLVYRHHDKGTKELEVDIDNIQRPESKPGNKTILRTYSLRPTTGGTES